MDTAVDSALARWREADLVSPEQETRIRAFEASIAPVPAAPPPAAEPATEPATRAGTGLIAEGLAYVGAALALGAGLALFGELWGDLGSAARIGLALVATVVLGVGAGALQGREEGHLSRLASVLAGLAVVGVATTVAIALVELTTMDADAVAALSGVAGLVAGVPVHVQRSSWPTTLALGGVLLTAVFGAEARLDLLDSATIGGVTLMGLGLAWAASGWSGLTRPQAAFEVTGLLAGGVGVQMLAVEDDLRVLALVVGLLVSAGALAVGLVEDRTSPAVLGGLGITVFAPQLVFQVFGETIGGPLALFVGGVSLVTVAVTILRRKDVV